MYSLHLTCGPEDVDLLSAELWEFGTAGIRETEDGRGGLTLIAGFEENSRREEMLRQFRSFSPLWTQEANTDWVAETQRAWPGREVGERFFLAAPWTSKPTPAGRTRLIHNPGLACGTGEHPCTQLALIALEQCVYSECTVADIGTGSGMLMIAALQLGAKRAIGVDTDEAALTATRENLELNRLAADMVAGSADCLCDAAVDLTIANISATVLLALADDLQQITRPGGYIILTGFPETELTTVAKIFPPESVLRQEGWSCVISKLALSASAAS